MNALRDLVLKLLLVYQTLLPLKEAIIKRLSVLWKWNKKGMNCVTYIQELFIHEFVLIMSNYLSKNKVDQEAVVLVHSALSHFN